MLQEMHGECEQMIQTLISGHAQSITQMQMQTSSKPQLQPVLRRHSSQSCARSHSPLAQPLASSSLPQGSVMQPSSPASPHPTITTGVPGANGSGPISRADAGAASALDSAASGSPLLTKAASSAIVAGTVRAVPGDADIPSSAPPHRGSLGSWVFGKSAAWAPVAAGALVVSGTGLTDNMLHVSAFNILAPDHITEELFDRGGFF